MFKFMSDFSNGIFHLYIIKKKFTQIVVEMSLPSLKVCTNESELCCIYKNIKEGRISFQ